MISKDEEKPEKGNLANRTISIQGSGEENAKRMLGTRNDLSSMKFNNDDNKNPTKTHNRLTNKENLNVLREFTILFWDIFMASFRCTQPTGVEWTCLIDPGKRY